MSKPIAVATGDVHFTLQTLELATHAVYQALALALALKVPLILNGDTLDGKAILRGECTNRLIEILSHPKARDCRVIINTGNHDLVNEKGKAHVLHFLKPYAEVIDVPTFDDDLDSWIIPYFNSTAELQEVLNQIPKGSRLFMHQGVLGADMGAYIKDSSSLPLEAFADFRVICSHYHRRQDLKPGRPRKGAVGFFSYMGAPYSVTAAEAQDGPKGINIVYDDGSLELVPTNLRKHVLAERTAETASDPIEGLNPCDLLHLKVTGVHSDLEKLNKRALGEKHLGHSNFKLTKIVTESEVLEEQDSARPVLDLLDHCVDLTAEPLEQKTALKALARELLG